MSIVPASATRDPIGLGNVTDREPALDGIRGLAILLVLVHHVVIYAGMARETSIDRVIFTLGASTWLGVDLFFVLSGFLITGILFDARTSPYYYSSFYGRRVLRIFPLYYGVLALAFVVLPRWLPADEASSLTASQGWYWLYLSNVQVAREGWQEPLHLSHFWSLAIEEQFYLMWPLVVRCFTRRRLMHISVGCCLLAFMLRLLAPHVGLSAIAAQVLLPTRLDSLAAGAFLALVIRTPGGLQAVRLRSRHVLTGCLAVAAVLFLWRRGFGPLDRVTGTIGLSVFAAGFSSLIAVALASPRPSVLRRCLTGASFVRLGQYSYGLYVFHQPIALMCHDVGLGAGLLPSVHGSQLPGLVAFGVIVGGLSLAAAMVSWHIWEQPFLRLKRHLPYRPHARSSVPSRAQSSALPTLARPDTRAP